jgi:hypothetical protein
MQELRTRMRSVSAEWMRRWGLDEQPVNPPRRARALQPLIYLNRYYKETAYIPQQTHNESVAAYKSRLYDMILTYLQVPDGCRRML